MRIIDPFASPQWSPFIIRLAVGVYFFLLGSWGVSDPEHFRYALEQFSGFSGLIATLYSTFGPWLLCTIGVFLVLGFMTIPATLASCLLFLPLFWSAGTFQSAHELQNFVDRRVLYRDLVVLVSAMSLLFSGAGKFSLDEMLQRIYEKKKS